MNRKLRGGEFRRGTKREEQHYWSSRNKRTSMHRETIQIEMKIEIHTCSNHYRGPTKYKDFTLYDGFHNFFNCIFSKKFCYT
mmetsp:Transcript_17301/g.36110  ORF Transcript_17301/g.36110 Transcript_17301/m.36110 type:complete len:82 (-) Transcript_17301:7-252(-)